MARVAKKPEIRKAELISAATKLFATKGLADTAVSDIVKEAGVAQGTFYLYFRSKQELANTIVESIGDRIYARLSQVVKSNSMNALDKLAALTNEIFTDLISDADIIRYFHHEANRRAHDSLNEKLAETLVPLLTEIIRQGIREKTFNTPYPDKAAIFLFGATMPINEKIIAEGGGPAGPWKIAILDFALKGLGCDPKLISQIEERLSTELLSV